MNVEKRDYGGGVWTDKELFFGVILTVVRGGETKKSEIFSLSTQPQKSHTKQP